MFQIVVRGNATSTVSLADYCMNTKDLVQGKVFTPRMNELVDATRESHIYQVNNLSNYNVPQTRPKLRHRCVNVSCLLGE